MYKAVIQDDEHSFEVEIPESIHHLSKLTNLIAAKDILAEEVEPEWDDAYAYLAQYFEKLYCQINERDDIDDILAEFMVPSKEDLKNGIELSVSIVDLA